VQPDGRMVVADGHHRLMASYLLGDATTRAEGW
jgi:ParB-like chromosome segregation protein Spo0J